MNLCHRVLALFVLCSTPLSATADVIDAEALTTTQFAALDRSKTAVIVPGGILEEHGPHLPSASDTYQARWLADSLARRIGSRPGWTAVMFPMIPLGHSGAKMASRIGVVAEAVLEGKPWDREAFFTIANMDPVDVQISVELRQREAGLEKRQADWLAKNPDAGPATKPD